MNDIQTIQSRIYEIRGQRVMLDRDLAELYQVTTGNLNKAVKRNIKRFPSDFMFQLTTEEWELLKFQIGILKNGRGQHTKYLPYAFTEQGIAIKGSKEKAKAKNWFYTRLKNLTDYYGN
ncbi:MAG: ORF6N domain-containing protein [Prevotella sp.]|nr:ORF6N domain-containing protein [Prevotella sp.]